MATNVADDPTLDAAGHAAPARGGKGKLIAILAVVMAAEAAGLYFVLPRSGGSSEASEEGEVAHDGHGHGEAGHGDHGHGDHGGSSAHVGAVVEVPIGMFRCTNGVASRGVTHHMTFEVNVTVASAQAAALTEAVKESHKSRVRQAIVQVARSSNLEDLKDPEFSVLKRQIKEEINKVLQKSYVNEVVISDFDLWDQ